MQFYFLLPPIYLLIRTISKIKPFLGNLLISICIVVSFAYQHLSSDTHMSLFARMWQFLCGFLVYYVKQSSLTKRFVDMSVFFSLIISLAIHIDKNLNRLFAVLLTSIIIVYQNETLTNKILVKLGNFSYSVYLIHWPLFALHRFKYIDEYQDESEVGLFGVTLITISLILGWMTEFLFNRIFKLVLTWKSLFLVLIFGYFLNFTLIHLLDKRAENMFTDKAPSIEWKNRLRIELQSVLTDNKSLSIPKLIELNVDMTRYAMHFGECENENDTIPSKFNMNISYMQYICHEKVVFMGIQGVPAISHDLTSTQLPMFFYIFYSYIYSVL
jgi:hypothetical protein